MRRARPPRILVVEDDAAIALGLRINLEAEGYEVRTAADGEAAIALAGGESFDLILLDIMLPKLSGYEVVCALRAQHCRAPIMVVSARGAELDKIMGLDLGADDYVTKPFLVGELLARIRALLRRAERREPSLLRFGDVEVDVVTRQVSKRGERVQLTPSEFDVLAALARAGGAALSREELMELVRGPRHFGTRRTIDNFVNQLRAKLEDDPESPRHLLTVRGVGYRLEPRASAWRARAAEPAPLPE